MARRRDLIENVQTICVSPLHPLETRIFHLSTVHCSTEFFLIKIAFL